MNKTAEPPKFGQAARYRRVPRVAPPKPSGEDQKDEAEALALQEGKNLERAKAHAEHVRSERFRNHLACGVIGGLWVAVAAVILMGMAWVFHLIAPAGWHFLTGAQLGRIETMLFGGGVGVFITSHLRKRLE